LRLRVEDVDLDRNQIVVREANGKLGGKHALSLLRSQPVIALDVGATACALAGLPSDPELDGVNLLPFLTGDNEGTPHETLYWRWLGRSAIRQGKWMSRNAAKYFDWYIEGKRNVTPR